MRSDTRLGHALLLALLALAAQAATLVRDPYLQNAGPEAVTVLWTTLEAGNGSVEYWAEGEAVRRAPAALRRFGAPETGLPFDYCQFSADLKGLRPGTQYRYRVLLDEELVVDGAALRFRTAGPGPFRFMVFGDSGTGGDDQLRLAQLITQEEPALVLHTGDVAQAVGAFSEYEDYYFAAYRTLMVRVPFFPAVGNHDYLTNSAAPYLAVHAFPASGVPPSDRGRYYSFDWGDAHFVSLDTNTPLAQAATGSGRMLEWLENDLRSTRRFWRIVYFHHPPYPAGPHVGEVLDELTRVHVTPILERYGVQVAFSGHEHFYMRTYPLASGMRVASGAGTTYVTTGGGGGALYQASNQPFIAFYRSTYHYLLCDVDGGRLTVRAVGIDGAEIDRFTLAPAPRLQAGAVVNSATYQPRLAPGSLTTIFGFSLAPDEQAARALPLPEELASTAVSLGGMRLPLLYASPTQINLQLPFGRTGRQTLTVTSPNGSADIEIDMAPAAPAVFVVHPPQGAFSAVVHLNGTLVAPVAPAAPGEFVSVYLTGLGGVQGNFPAGYAAPASPPIRTVATTTALLSDRVVACAYSGLAPGFAGLYQVNLKIPEDAPTGSYALRIVADGVQSEPVPLPVGY